MTDVASFARASAEAGADAVSLVNTFLAMAIDVETRRPKLSNVMGGLSGPAIRPIAIRMVHECRQAVDLPIIGMGGIATPEDAPSSSSRARRRSRSARPTSWIRSSGRRSSAASTYLDHQGPRAGDRPGRHRGAAGAGAGMNPILVALDLADAAAALALADRLRGAVGRFKIGSQLFSSAGPEIVRTLASRGDRVFLDLKFHDIPNTVAGAVAAATGLGVWMLNVHASGGSAMLEAAREAADAAAGRTGRPRPLVIAVTVLTSLDAAALQATGIQRSPSTRSCTWPG
ncbi:MAG: orotidine-5'-phosphate decarboxylase [Vicinamibacterales bacterium]